MRMSHARYAPEFRRQMVELVRACVCCIGCVELSAPSAAQANERIPAATSTPVTRRL
jgi:hypothetical protein